MQLLNSTHRGADRCSPELHGSSGGCDTRILTQTFQMLSSVGVPLSHIQGAASSPELSR